MKLFIISFPKISQSLISSFREEWIETCFGIFFRLDVLV
ncbi:hypothetical protein LEP1GSC035_3471 [Leptospira noguchii str. 2007001578]|uniref:Uncharacterized protein n=1 Tax=Leptospira noguchii str. 2007001578 TaxID=1049974 RepID=A0ABN0IWD3_9LEPT|nr:hypothetical protein LEP1GSC035_3471 [Leptospira noguchii str. 2007001578]